MRSNDQRPVGGLTISRIVGLGGFGVPATPRHIDHPWSHTLPNPALAWTVSPPSLGQWQRAQPHWLEYPVVFQCLDGAGRDFAVVALCNLGGNTALAATDDIAARMIQEFSNRKDQEWPLGRWLDIKDRPFKSNFSAIQFAAAQG